MVPTYLRTILSFSETDLIVKRSENQLYCYRLSAAMMLSSGHRVTRMMATTDVAIDAIWIDSDSLSCPKESRKIRPHGGNSPKIANFLTSFEAKNNGM